MKTYLIFVCMLITSGLASAAPQTGINQDKPPRLYIKSYTAPESDSLSISGNSETLSSPSGWWTDYNIHTWTSDYTSSENTNFEDGIAGTSFENWSYQFSEDYTNIPGAYNPFNFGDSRVQSLATTLSWGATFFTLNPSLYSGISVTELDTYNDFSTSYSTFSQGGTNNYSTTWTDAYNVSINQEHCAINISTTRSSPLSPNALYYEVRKYTYNRSAQTIIKLQTGGKSTSKLKNLFGLNGSAVQNYYDLSTGYVTGTTNIPPQNITIGSYGNLDANGVMYKILPDNADVDVTPSVAGADYYTFGVGAQKYHSYFDLFVQQANPGYSLWPSGAGTNIGNDFGHASWRFRTDAPSDALQYISTNLTKFLGKKWGFYPTNDPAPGPLNGWTVPGFVEDDATHSANICRTFYIGFYPDLIRGLEFTKGIFNAPPNWSVSGNNCVSAARDAGFEADVYGLPWDMSPQNFGVTLIEMYPAPGQIIGPFWDDTDIFYSSAPY